MKETDEYDESEGKKAVKEFPWMPAGCSPLADGEYGKRAVRQIYFTPKILSNIILYTLFNTIHHILKMLSSWGLV
jgi:hypothetical protein